MSKQIREKLGEIHRVRTVKTFGDHAAEFLRGVATIAVIVGILIAIFA